MAKKSEEDDIFQKSEDSNQDKKIETDNHVSNDINKSKIPSKRYKIQEVIKPNQVILVQVLKDERGLKGAALTTFISIAGKYIVLRLDFILID